MYLSGGWRQNVENCIRTSIYTHNTVQEKYVAFVYLDSFYLYCHIYNTNLISQFFIRSFLLYFFWLPCLLCTVYTLSLIIFLNVFLISLCLFLEHLVFNYGDISEEFWIRIRFLINLWPRSGFSDINPPFKCMYQENVTRYKRERTILINKRIK